MRYHSEGVSIYVGPFHMGILDQVRPSVFLGDLDRISIQSHRQVDVNRCMSVSTYLRVHPGPEKNTIKVHFWSYKWWLLDSSFGRTTDNPPPRRVVWH